MTKETLKNLTPEQLRTLLAEQREKLVRMRQELIGKKLSNTSQIGQARKQVARILTALGKIQ